MLIKSNISPKNRQKVFNALFAAAQIAFVLGMVLSRLDWPGMDFLEGLLVGFSLVGNLAYLVNLRNLGRGS
jgi:hypothetical protein